jgi:hypothetical protein
MPFRPAMMPAPRHEERAMGGRLAKVLLIMAAMAALAVSAGGGGGHRSSSPPLAVSAPADGDRLAAHERAGDEVCGRRWA